MSHNPVAQEQGLLEVGCLLTACTRRQDDALLTDACNDILMHGRCWWASQSGRLMGCCFVLLDTPAASRGEDSWHHQHGLHCMPASEE